MNFITTKNRFVLVLALIIGFTTACKKKTDDPQPVVQQVPAFRTNTIDYNTLTPTTSYRSTFLDSKGDSTVDRTEGRNLLRMFRALAAYVNTGKTTPIDSTTLSNMFANKNNAFSGEYIDLNGLNISIKEATAASKSNQAEVHNYLEVAFGRMAYISTKATQTATKGTAGMLGTYLVDEEGVEWGQIIQKGLIGSFHLDYIGNVLLKTGLNAGNHKLVAGKNYTALEHNWDEAYGFLTNNDMYYNGTVNEKIEKTFATEYYLGAYSWEYNKSGFVKLHSAFLKGRAAIHNNDMAVVKVQADIIRDIFEKAIAASAEGYMYKAGLSTATEASRAHAFGEGLGFIYSTRFCTLSGADDAFSSGLKNSLINSVTPTFYDVTASQYMAARTTILSKFNLVIVH